MPRKTYKKRTYKKRAYKTRRYRKRFYKRRFYNKSIKKPEIHIYKGEQNVININNGVLKHLTPINPVIDLSSGGYTDSDAVEFKLDDKLIDGRKIRLKYLYIKGYFNLFDTSDDNINAKFYVFRYKKNVNNSNLSWSSLMDLPIGVLDTPTSWTASNKKDILYTYDWKNDINNVIKRKVKNMYRKYDDNNNLVPFKIRIPLYDCVLTCDTKFDSTSGRWTAESVPSTNSLWCAFLTTATLYSGTGDAETSNYCRYKWKLYYTDY